MATYYVNSGAVGADTGGSWTDAFLTFAQGVTAANAAADIIKVHKTHTEEIAADTVYTFLAHVSVITVDKDSSDALATMATAAWIGNSTTNYSVSLSGSFKIYVYGLTLRTAGGATTDNIGINPTADSGQYTMESCYFWSGNTNASSRITFGSSQNSYVKVVNCTMRLGNVAAAIGLGGVVDIEGGSISSAGSAPTVLIRSLGNAHGDSRWSGVDLSHCGSAILVGSDTASTSTAIFTNCKFGSGFVLLATQATANRGGACVYAYNCASGDSNVAIAYADAFGTLVVDTAIYFTSGAAQLSWKIVTTANCLFGTPFETPWFDYYNATLSAISPYVEILRDLSATEYQDDEVWAEFSYQGTSGFPLALFGNDRMLPLGTAANQAAGAGLGSWTGENATAWSGKLGGNSVTPAELGHIRCRIVVGEPSITVYADPQVRV